MKADVNESPLKFYFFQTKFKRKRIIKANWFPKKVKTKLQENVSNEDIRIQKMFRLLIIAKHFETMMSYA